MQNLIRWLHQKPADLNLHCFIEKIYQSSAGQGLSTFGLDLMESQIVMEFLVHSKHSLDKIVSFSENNLFDHMTSVVRLTYILVGLILYIPVNRYGHGGMVSSPIRPHFFSWASLVNLYFVH